MGIFAKIWNFLTGKKEVEEPVKQAKPANVKPIKKTAPKKKAVKPKARQVKKS
jgi:hypothetical protein